MKPYGPSASITLEAPASDELEQAILGSILLDPSLFQAYGERLSPELFHGIAHQAIWQGIAGVLDDGQPLDQRTLQDRMEHQGSWESAGGIVKVSALEEALPDSVYDRGRFEVYLALLEEYTTRRKLINGAVAVAQMASRNGQPVEAMVAKAQRLMGEAGRDAKPGGYRPVGTVLQEGVRPLLTGGRPMAGITTGLPGLDDMLCGWREGRLYVIGGRPSMGKSSLAGLFALRAAEAGASVGIVSLEETEAEWGLRLLAISTSVPGRMIESGDLTLFERETIEAGMQRLANLSIQIDDSGEPAATVILSRAKRLKPRLLIVDHLGYIGTDRDRVREVGAITKGLKRWAKAEGASVLLLCQLSRRCEERPEKRPVLPDLRESGDVEQDADAVGFVFRAEYYDKKPENAGRGELLVRKQRGGRVGTVPLWWQATTTTFYEDKKEQ